MSNRSTECGSWLSHLRAQRIQPFLHPTDKLLEFGARNDLNLAELKAAAKLSIKPGDEMPSLSDIDLALCDHVLEYLTDPVEVLIKLKQALKSGGTLLIFALYDKGFRHSNRTRPVEHFYSWNLQTLGNLVIDCGYEFQSGAVTRRPDEEFAVRCTEKWRLGETGFRAAAAISRLFLPEFEVRVVAKRP